MNHAGPISQAAHQFRQAQSALLDFFRCLAQRRPLPREDRDEFLAVMKRVTDAHSQMRIEESVRFRQVAESARRYKLASDTFHHLLNEIFEAFAARDSKRVERCYVTFQNFLAEWDAPPRTPDEIRAEVAAQREEIGKQILMGEQSPKG